MDLDTSNNATDNTGWWRLGAVAVVVVLDALAVKSVKFLLDQRR